MANRMKEIIFWVQDVWQHIKVSQRRRALQNPDRGFDYTNDIASMRKLVADLHPKRMRLQVKEVRQTTPSAKTFVFERVDGELPPFRPGQYLNIFVDVDGVLTSRPYSIASSPDPQTLEITIREKPNGFVSPFLLRELRVGDVLESTGPSGNFYYEPITDGTKLVFLAGGSGITPFMSIIRDVLANELPLEMHLLYGSRVLDDVLYEQELIELASAHANLHYALIISEPPANYDGLTGFIDARIIKQLIGNVGGKTFYICGPREMYDFCLAALLELGVPSYKIRRELYGPPEDITQEPDWPQSVDANSIFEIDVIGEKSIKAPANEPLLNTLERYGIQTPATCRVGECSACRVKVLSGNVFMPASTGVRESDRTFGYIHACVAYPLEDLQIQL